MTFMSLLLYFLSSFGIITVIMVVSNCIYNLFSYTTVKKHILTGLFLGLSSILFNFYYFSVNGAPVFDMRFIIVIILTLCFDNKVLYSFAPLYLAGVYFSSFSVWFAAAVLFVTLVIGFLKIGKNVTFLLLIMTILPIVFSEIQIFGYVTEYEGKLFLTAAAATSLCFIIIFMLLSVLLKKNFMGIAFLRTYLISTFSKFDSIYTFKIDRKLSKVTISQKCVDDLEFPSLSIPYATFCDVLDDSTDKKIKPINRKIDSTLFVTSSTGRERFIEYACYRRISGGYNGYINDITEHIPRYELLYKTISRDYITGFSTYPALKEGILRLTQDTEGIILFVYIESALVFYRNSLYEIEFEILCFRYLSALLKKEFPTAEFYSIKSGEIFMAISGYEKSEDALSVMTRLKNLFANTYEIGEKSIIFRTNLGVYFTESKRVSNLYEVGEVLKRLAFCSIMVGSQKSSNTYIFSENAYEDYCQKQLRVKHLPHIIENGEAKLAFQPIFNLSTGEIELYEVLIRITNDIYLNTGDFISDCIAEGYDVELDKMVLKMLLENIKSGALCENISVNLLGNTPITDEIKEMTSILSRYGKTLYIEITEHMDNEMDDLRYKANKIKSFGAKIVADDYGLGYANNAMLSYINFDIIKLPQEIVSRVITDYKTECMIRSIVNYCKELGIKCVAEGIETKSAYVKLRNLGVDLGQGYFMRKPTTDIPNKGYIFNHEKPN